MRPLLGGILVNESGDRMNGILRAMANLNRRNVIRMGAGGLGAAVLGARTGMPAAGADSAAAPERVFPVSAYLTNRSISVESAISAAVADAGTVPCGIVDFGGVDYVTEQTVGVSEPGVTLRNGGIRVDGPYPALVVNAADVTVRDMTFSRAQTSRVLDSGWRVSCVAVNGERFASYNCDYLGSYGPCVYLTNGSCNGTAIRGGKMTGTAARQNASGVYAAGGTRGNSNITVEGVHIFNVTDGILLFNTGESRVANNLVQKLRKLPTVALTGWTNVSRNVWRQRTSPGTPGVDGVSTDREDGATRALVVNGERWGQVANSEVPREGSAGLSGGYVYINLGGGDPNAASISSDIVSGYAIVIYAVSTDTTHFCGRNVIVDNTIEDCDGFGIYLQVGGNADAVENQIVGNTLRDSCRAGVQMSSLPFAAIGITGGANTLISGNYINGVGSPDRPVPGIRVDFPEANSGTPSGRIIGATVSNSYGEGFEIRSSNWSLLDCRAEKNQKGGFRIFSDEADNNVTSVTLTNCSAEGNGSAGFIVDGSQVGRGVVSAEIIGGFAVGNGGKGVSLKAATATVKNLVEIPR